jgi:Fe2+ or Zn2+ uptake regulation protein
MASDDLMRQLAAVRSTRRIARHTRHARSRLDRHRAEIEALIAAGASTYDIALWLRQFKRTKVHPTTVWRALKRWYTPDV